MMGIARVERHFTEEHTQKLTQESSAEQEKRRIREQTALDPKLIAGTPLNCCGLRCWWGASKAFRTLVGGIGVLMCLCGGWMGFAGRAAAAPAAEIRQGVQAGGAPATRCSAQAATRRRGRADRATSGAASGPSCGASACVVRLLACSFVCLSFRSARSFVRL